MTIVIILCIALVIVVALIAWRYRELLRDFAHFARALLKHPSIPRPVRWLLILALIPIPGPIDEIAAVLVLLILVAFHRQLLVKTWQEIRA